MEDKTVGIVLKFALAEEAAAKKAAANLTDLAKKFATLQKEADETRKGIAKALEQGENADALRKKLVEVQSELSKTGDKALELQRKMDSAKWESVQKLGQGLQNAGDKIGQIGSAMGAIGAVGFGAIFASAQKFVNESPLDEVSQRWISSQNEMEQSFLRIGRVAADQLLPFLEKAADMAEDTAEFVEKNPELIKALIGITGGLAIGGAALQGASTAMKVGGAAVELFGKGGLALGKAGGAGAIASAATPVAVGAAALGVGGYIGYQAGNAVNRAIGQEEQSGSDIWKTAQQLSAIVSPLGLISQGLNAAGFEEQASNLWEFNKALNGLGEAAEGAEAAASKEPIVTEAMLTAFDAWEQAGKDIEAFEKESAAEREEIVAQAGAQRVEIERRYEETRTKTTESYLTARADSEADYYRSRTDAARRYGVEVQRAEQDHQRRMRQLQESHNQRLQGLVDNRDALGVVREIDSYESQRREEEQNHQVEMRRKSEDFAAELVLMERNFRVQQDRRAREYERQVAEIDARQAAEAERLRVQNEEKLKVFDAQQRRELDALKKNEENRYAVLRNVALNDNSLLHRETAEMTARYKEWLEAASRNLSLPPTVGGYNAPPGRANGGYAGDGIYRLGERGTEYVMDNGLTKTAERTLGGPVTKYGLTEALLGRSGRNNGPAGGNSSVNMRIETQSLTLSQVISEIDSRLARNNNSLSRAFGG